MIELAPPPLLLPARPAIIRPAEHALLRPGAFRPATREERRAVIAELVRGGRATLEEARRAIFFFPLVGWKKTAAALTLAFQASATSTTSSITIPAGAAAGDVAFLFQYSDNQFSSGGTPSGWTNLNATSNAGQSETIFCRKILVGGDPGSSVTGLLNGSPNGQDAIMLVFRPSAAIASVVNGTWTNQAVDTNPASQTVTVAAVTPPLIVFGLAGVAGGTVAFSTASPAFDGTVLTTGSDGGVGYKIYNSSPANHTIDINDLGNSNYLGSGYVRFT